MPGCGVDHLTLGAGNEYEYIYIHERAAVAAALRPPLRPGYKDKTDGSAGSRDHKRVIYTKK
jgi:hypothetical protein